MASGPITSWQIEAENVEAVTDFLYLGSKITVNGDWSHGIRCLLLGRKAMTNLDSVLKSRDITPLTMVLSQVYGLPNGHVQWTLWKLDCKEGRVPKNWYLWTVVLEKTPEIPLDNKEIKPTNLKGNKPLILFGRTDVEVEAPVFWSPGANSWLIGKSPWCCERLKAEGEESIRGWDGWMASPTQWAWVWVNSGSWWWTGRPGVLWFMESQIVGHD